MTLIDQTLYPKHMLPARFSEGMFRRYEDSIAKIIEVYPSIVVMEPNNLSSETVAARLRDAIRSVATYQWRTDKFSVDLLRELLPTLAVTRRGEHVIAGRKQELQANSTEMLVAASSCTSAEPQFSLELPSDDLLAVRCAIILHHRGYLSKPTRVGGVLPPAFVEEMLNDFVGIEIESFEDHTLIV